MNSCKAYLIRLYKWTWIICAIFAVLIMISAGSSLLFLLAEHREGLFGILITVSITGLFWFYFRHFQMQIVLSKDGVEVKHGAHLDYSASWNDFLLLYIMQASYVLPVKYIFLTREPISEKRRMLVAAFSPVKRKPLRQGIAFPVRNRDIQFVQNIISPKIVIINEI